MVSPPLQMAPPASSPTQSSPYTPAYHSQFANATPFIPRSGLSYPPPPSSSLPPPPTSAIPPPPTGQQSSESGSGSMSHEAPSSYSHSTGSHGRTGITAAQLYSLNVIGSGRPSSLRSSQKSQFPVLQASLRPRAHSSRKLRRRRRYRPWSSAYCVASKSEQPERSDQSESHSPPRRRLLPSLLPLERRRRLDQRRLSLPVHSLSATPVPHLSIHVPR